MEQTKMVHNLVPAAAFSALQGAEQRGATHQPVQSLPCVCCPCAPLALKFNAGPPFVTISSLAWRKYIIEHQSTLTAKIKPYIGTDALS